MLNLQANQLVAAKASPEAEQNQGAVAPVPKSCGTVVTSLRMVDGQVEPIDHHGQLGQLQRLGPLFHRRMQGLDSLEHLFDDGCAGRIDKALRSVPLRKCSEALFECIDRQRAGIGDEIARHTVCGGRQVTTPSDFEMTYGGGVAAPSIGACRGGEVPIDRWRRRITHLNGCATRRSAGRQSCPGANCTEPPDETERSPCA